MGFDGWNAASGAASGAATGGMFGPIGALAGGVGGGLLGGFKPGDEPAKVEDFYKAATPTTQSPMGGQRWTQGPDGKWKSTYGFSGPAAGTFDALQGNMAKAANYDPTQARDQAIASNYDQATSRLDPMWQQRGQAFTSGMANQGLDPGTQAYDAQFGNESRAMNDAYSTAMANAIRQGNETQATQMAQMNQPFQQGSQMLGMLDHQGQNLNAPLLAAGMTQKANDNAADRAAANSGGKKGGAGGLLGGLGGKGGGGSNAAPNNDYNSFGSIPKEM